MTQTKITLQTEHQRVKNPEGAEARDRYFKLRLDRQAFKAASKSTAAPKTRKRNAPKYFIRLLVSFPKRTTSKNTFAIIPMGQLAAILPKDSTHDGDLVVEIDGSLGDPPLLVIELKIKKRSEMQKDKYWALLQIGDEVFPNVLTPEDIFGPEVIPQKAELEPGPQPELEPSPSFWPLPLPETASMQMIFQAGTGELDHVKLADPTPWINPTAAMRRSSISEDDIYFCILFKHPARGGQGPPKPRTEEGDIVAEFGIQLRPKRVIHPADWFDDLAFGIPVEGVPIVLVSDPPAEPQALDSAARVRFDGGVEVIGESKPAPRPLHAAKPALRLPTPAFPEFRRRPSPPPLPVQQHQNTLSRVFKGIKQSIAEPEGTGHRRVNSLRFWGKK